MNEPRKLLDLSDRELLSFVSEGLESSDVEQQDMARKIVTAARGEAKKILDTKTIDPNLLSTQKGDPHPTRLAALKLRLVEQGGLKVVPLLEIMAEPGWFRRASPGYLSDTSTRLVDSMNSALIDLYKSNKPEFDNLRGELLSILRN